MGDAFGQPGREARVPPARVRRPASSTGCGRGSEQDRIWNIDELPQITNVLKGEMSRFGPRPLWVDEAKQYRGSTRNTSTSHPPSRACGKCWAAGHPSRRDGEARLHVRHRLGLSWDLSQAHAPHRLTQSASRSQGMQTAPDAHRSRMRYWPVTAAPPNDVRSVRAPPDSLRSSLAQGIEWVGHYVRSGASEP